MRTPGSHIIRQGDPRTAIALEAEGYEVRDCIHVVTTAGVEQWWLARWPLDGTMPENVQKHGVGPLDINACRIGTSGATTRNCVATFPKKPDGTEDREPSLGWRTGHRMVEVEAGRWPPNLIFLHAEGCKRVGEKLVRASHEIKGAQRTEVVPDYLCQPGCPVPTLDRQSLISKHSKKGSDWSAYLDEGYAARFFPCLESRAQLDDWFARLTRSPNASIGNP